MTTAAVKSPIHDVIQWGGSVTISGLDKAKFNQLTALYPELRMDRDKNGNINIMTPVKGGSGIRETRLLLRVSNFCEQNLGGQVFSPSTGFDLPDGSTKSPDVAWIDAERMKKLTPQQIEETYIPVVPNFVAEIRSQSDSLKKLQEKMADTWIANGVQLAWLIDPYQEKAHIYRKDGSVEIITDFDQQLSGEAVLSGFLLNLKEFKLLGKS